MLQFPTRKPIDIEHRMIVSRLLRPILLSAAILPGAASAVGLGEINLHSHIGEALRADISIIAGGENLDAACFSLDPVPEADFPVIRAARPRLVRNGQDVRLILTGSRPISEPVVLIRLRAACGMDIKRDYVLLPAPPLVHSSDIEPPPTRAEPDRTRRTEAAGNARASVGNTDLQPTEKPRRPRAAPRPPPQPRKPLPRETLASLADGQDRIVLGAAPPRGTSDPLAPLHELDERLLKMETTLHILNEEVDKLAKVAALGAESRAMREKLQEFQAQQAAPTTLPAAPAAVPPTPADTRSSANAWLELLFGLLLGGSVSAGVAHLVSRHQDNARRAKHRSQS